jgi:hypothetical protein
MATTAIDTARSVLDAVGADLVGGIVGIVCGVDGPSLSARPIR